MEDSLRPYYQRRKQLTLKGDSILWGIRVVIPWKLRSRILDELHQGHPGVIHMKSMTCGYVWWPGLDNDLEELSRNCKSCQMILQQPRFILGCGHLRLGTWTLQGHFKMWLIAVDAHSKWPASLCLRHGLAGNTRFHATSIQGTFSC